MKDMFKVDGKKPAEAWHHPGRWGASRSAVLDGSKISRHF